MPQETKTIQTIDMETLMATSFPPCKFIVEGLLPCGLNLWCGQSKIGKSWLMLWLCICVANGEPLWTFPTNRCDVLYLTLEDPLRRVKKRASMLTDSAPANLRIAVAADRIGTGLEKQLEDELHEHPKTKLIVIDTLQRVRGTSGSKMSYEADYADMTALKRIADEYGICLVLVHHLRKVKDSNDSFNDISGSTGLMGAADTSFVMRKKKRAEKEAVLYITGRDVKDRELELTFSGCHWLLTNCLEDEELREKHQPPILTTVINYIKKVGHFRGSATELLGVLGETVMNPSVLTRTLSDYAYERLEPEGIAYATGRTSSGRWLELCYVPHDESDGHDGNDGYLDSTAHEKMPSSSS